jgi:hypothetical protein
VTPGRRDRPWLRHVRRAFGAQVKPSPVILALSRGAKRRLTRASAARRGEAAAYASEASACYERQRS